MSGETKAPDYYLYQLVLKTSLKEWNKKINEIEKKTWKIWETMNDVLVE